MAGDFDLTVVVGDTRLGRTERLAERVPLDTALSSVDAGGCRELSCGLLRGLQDDGPERLFDPVTVYDPAGREVWTGRLQGKPRTVTRTTQRQTAQALGWAVVLEDRQDVRFLGIDRDLGKWTPLVPFRQQAFLSGGYRPTAATAENAGLKFDGSGTWGTDAKAAIGATYDAAPLTVGRVLWSHATATGMWADWVAHVVAIDGGAATTIGGDWMTAADPGPHPAQNVAVGAPAVEVAAYYPTPWTVDAVRSASLQYLMVVGDHGLTLTGTSPLNYGLKAADVVAYLIGQYCPGLTPGDIADSAIGIPHFAHLEPTTVGDLVGNLNAYHQWAWGVWEGRRFDFRPHGTGTSKTWHVRAGDAGVQIEQTGDSAADLWTGVVVTGQTASGESFTVGPPGSIADTFHDELDVASLTSAHPAKLAGVERYYHFALSVPTNTETAVHVGQMLLGQLNSARRSGTATITGYVSDEYGSRRPVYDVRGGDQLVIVDIGDAEPIRITEAAYQHPSRSVQLTLGTNLQTVEALVAHIGARTTGRI